MKRLGITQSLTNYHFYPDWFQKTDLGDDIELVFLSFEAFDLPSLATLDGVLFSGGIDIYPGCYTTFLPYPNAPEPFQHQRDLFVKSTNPVNQTFLLGIEVNKHLV